MFTERAIKIEIIVDSDGIIPSSVAQAPPSLLNRLGAVAAATPKHTAASLETPVSNHTQSNIQTQEHVHHYLTSVSNTRTDSQNP